jgi:hypothetical protein
MNKNKLITFTIPLLIGSLISYILTQFSLLKINYEINISESIIDIITVIIGLFIAINIQQNHNKNQKQYTIIEKKMDPIWEYFISEINNLDSNNSNLTLRQVTELHKKVSLKIDHLIEIFDSFELPPSSINQLKTEINNLLEFIEQRPEKQNNVIYFTKEDIVYINKKYNEINKLFAVCLNNI